tara:strand:- start:571 stop:771 length:201 start_codon:yes stop_codon:yes gene_type:complete
VNKNSDIDKLSRIIFIENYLTQLVIENRGHYKPHTQDENQHLRDEVDCLRKEMGIIDEEGKLIKMS